MKKKLLELFENPYLSLNFKAIKTYLTVKKNDEEDLKSILLELELDGSLFKNEDDSYSKMPENYKVGTVKRSKSEKVSVEVKNKKYKVKEENINGALPEDKVVLDIQNSKIVSVINRINNLVVCEVAINDGVKYLRPFNVVGDLKLRIDLMSMKHCIPGQRILVRISEEKNDNIYEAYFLKSIGYKDDPDIDLKCIALSNGFTIDFSDEALEEIKDIPVEVTEKDLKDRKDLRHKLIYTIDGEHTKDMDDAISVEKLPNGNYLLGVHIAHVSHYIKPETNLFNEAIERATSLYLIDSVIPMFPPEVSNGICSLNPNVDRLARTVEMEINSKGEIVKYNIFPSVINSRKKMTYESINKMFQTGIVKTEYKDYIENLYLAKELNSILESKRNNRGSIEFDSSELEVELDEKGKVADLHLKRQEEAENIIENFMLLANETVAKHAQWMNMPFVYRNHDLPDKERILNAIEFISQLGFRVNCIGNTDNPQVLQNIIRTLSSKNEFPVLSSLLLSSMKKANYGTHNLGHYGLALNEYSHFTSPIRRLPDLLVHTLFDQFQNLSMNRDDLKKLETKLQEMSEHASLKERQADMAEKQAEKLKMIEYINDNIGKKFPARITFITSKFMTIKTDNGIEGIILFDDILGDDYIFDKNTTSLIGKSSKYKYKPGMVIEVMAKCTSVENLTIFFYTGNKKSLKQTQYILKKNN